jgi:hypothetical protein
LSIPNDPVILLSYINTQLRDYYPNLEELCKSLVIDSDILIHKLESIDYYYNEKRNQFI